MPDFTDGDLDESVAERFRQLHAEGREQMLQRLKEVESDGESQVEWLSSKDDAVCALCRERDGKILTIAEARALLGTDYCCASDEGTRTSCRCTFLFVIGPT